MTMLYSVMSNDINLNDIVSDIVTFFSDGMSLNASSIASNENVRPVYHKRSKIVE